MKRHKLEIFDKLFTEKLETYCNKYIAKQLATSLACDIVDYINEQKYETSEFARLGIKTYYNYSEKRYFIFTDSIKNEIHSNYLNILLACYANDIELYHLHSDKLLYALIHYQEELTKIKRCVDKVFTNV